MEERIVLRFTDYGATKKDNQESALMDFQEKYGADNDDAFKTMGERECSVNLWRREESFDAVDLSTEKDKKIEVSKERIQDENTWHGLKRYGLYGITKIANADICFCEISDEETTAEGDYVPLSEGFSFYNCRSNHIKLKLVMGGKEYLSNKITLVDEINESRKEEIGKMLREVYEKQPLLLLSAFRKYPINVFTDKDSNIPGSIDVRLRLLGETIKVYKKGYGDIRRAMLHKLEQYKYIDRIEKLTSLDADTIQFISQNPQFLIEVKKKKGIRYNGRTYLPEKTRISRNVEDYNTYENRYIVSFLRFQLNECVKIKKNLESIISAARTYKNNAKLKSQKEDFAAWEKKSELQLTDVCRKKSDIAKLYRMYSTAFQMDKDKSINGVIKKPKMTAVFRQLPEYNTFYKNAFEPWFNHGLVVDNDNKGVLDTFTTAVSNRSTTYELFIVKRLIDYFTNKGFEYQGREAKYAGIHEKESGYSDAAYEFRLVKSSIPSECKDVKDELEFVTLYYSPSVYIPNEKYKDKNVDELLFRKTKNSRIKDNDETNGQAAHYEPDFIIKYQKGRVIRYIMADAKFKGYQEVKKRDIRDIIEKYVTDLDVYKPENRKDELKDIDAAILGAVVIYHLKEGEDIQTDYYEFKNYSDNNIVAKMFYLNVLDSADGFNDLMDDLMKYVGDNVNEVIERKEKIDDELNQLLEKCREGTLDTETVAEKIKSMFRMKPVLSQ